MSTLPPLRLAASPDVDDDEVVRLWKAGRKTQAIESLVRRDGRVIFGLCARVLKDAAVAEDVMQQVFIEAWRDFDAFQAKSNLRGWLMGIASHRCLDAVKRRRREEARTTDAPVPVAVAPDELVAPGDRLDTQRQLRALDDCLRGLSDDVRATVLLRFQSGLSYEALSAQAGQRPATLQARVARALPVLRDCLETKGFAP